MLGFGGIGWDGWWNIFEFKDLGVDPPSSDFGATRELGHTPVGRVGIAWTGLVWKRLRGMERGRDRESRMED